MKSFMRPSLLPLTLLALAFTAGVCQADTQGTERQTVKVSTRAANGAARRYAQAFAKAGSRKVQQVRRVRWSLAKSAAYGYRVDFPGLRVERVRFKNEAGAAAFLKRAKLEGKSARTFLQRGNQVVLLSGSELSAATPSARQELLESAWGGPPAPRGKQTQVSTNPSSPTQGQVRKKRSGARGLIAHHFAGEKLATGTVTLKGQGKAKTQQNAQQQKAFNPEADLRILEETLSTSITTMNARGQRFDHPIGALSGLWGNTLYKYQKTGRFSDAPFGALFDRLYNEKGRYKDVQECYGQAEIVLDALRKRLPELSGAWELGMADQPGHYWAVARIDLRKEGSALSKKQLGSGKGPFMFVHMDPWKADFEVTYGDAKSVSWHKR